MVKKHKIDSLPVTTGKLQPVSQLVDQLKPMNEIECELTELRNAIAKPGDPEDLRIRKAMMVLLSAVSEQSTDIPHLTETTGLTEEFVARIADKMRAAGEWNKAGIDSRRWLYDDGELRFIFLVQQTAMCLGEFGSGAGIPIDVVGSGVE